MIGGIYFDLKINGKTIPVENENDLLKLKTYIDECLAWVRHTPKFYAPSISLSLPFPESGDTELKNQELAASVTTERISVNEANSQSPPMTTIDFAVMALGYLNGGANIINAINAARDLGWKTRSKDVKNAMRTFTIMVRQNADLVTVEKGTMTLTPAGYAKFHEMMTLQAKKDEDSLSEMIASEMIAQEEQSSPDDEDGL